VKSLWKLFVAKGKPHNGCPDACEVSGFSRPPWLRDGIETEEHAEAVIGALRSNNRSS
jgi:hypothetical protein